MAKSRTRNVTKDMGKPDCYTADAGAKPVSDLVQRLFGDGLFGAESEPAKTNIFRIFYQRQAQPLMNSELYDVAEDPLFRANAKMAMCLMLSEMTRIHVRGTLETLFRKLFCIIRAQQELAGHPGHASDKLIFDHLLPLQWRFDDIVALPTFPTLTSEELFQIFAEVLDEEYSSRAVPALTKEQAVRHLLKSYGEHCTDYDWSCEGLRLMASCLEFSYTELKDMGSP
jgi:hypothetical protein